MRRLLGFLALTLTVLTVAQIANGAVNARLDGKFRATISINKANDGNKGAVISRNYAFTALCPNGPCPKVGLRREGPSGENYRSILRRKSSGTFQGVETSGGLKCPGSDADGVQRVKYSLRVTAQEDGLATAIQGRANLIVKCPGEDPFQKGTFFGELR